MKLHFSDSQVEASEKNSSDQTGVPLADSALL
jgi:hypothetical protein